MKRYMVLKEYRMERFCQELFVANVEHLLTIGILHYTSNPIL